MTVTILFLVFNIVTLSVIATLSELSRKKMDKVHQELCKISQVTRELTANPAQARAELKQTMQVMDYNLRRQIPRPFPGHIPGSRPFEDYFPKENTQEYRGEIFRDSPDLLGDWPQRNEPHQEDEGSSSSEEEK